MQPYVYLDDRPNRIALPTIVTGIAGESFKLLEAVRGGGNAMVFSARPVASAHDDIDLCAVKILRRRDGARLDRFSNEIRIMRELDHHRIAQLFDEGELDLDGERVPWAALELGGENLRRHVQSHGPLPSAQLLQVSLQMLEALAHIHARGIVHRDIKPDNFVWNEEQPGSVLMIDFGIAKRAGEDVSARPLDQFIRNTLSS
jgi:serine/threonine protein kinase